MVSPPRNTGQERGCVIGWKFTGKPLTFRVFGAWGRSTSCYPWAANSPPQSSIEGWARKFQRERHWISRGGGLAHASGRRRDGPSELKVTLTATDCVYRLSLTSSPEDAATAIRERGGRCCFSCCAASRVADQVAQMLAGREVDLSLRQKAALLASQGVPTRLVSGARRMRYGAWWSV